MTNVLSVHSRKGGVGKTSISLGVAADLARRGSRVLLLELDTIGCHLWDTLLFANDWERTTTPKGEPRYRFRGQDRRHSVQEWIMRDSSHPTLPYLAETNLLSTETIEEAVVRAGLGRLYVAPLSTSIGLLAECEIFLRRYAARKPIGTSLALGLQELRRENFDWLVVDHQPGFTSTSLAVLRWMFEAAGRNGRTSFNLLSICGSSWWDSALALDEMPRLVGLSNRNIKSIMVINGWRDTTHDESSMPDPQHPLLRISALAEGVDRNEKDLAEIIAYYSSIPKMVASRTDPDSTATLLIDNGWGILKIPFDRAVWEATVGAWNSDKSTGSTAGPAGSPVARQGPMSSTSAREDPMDSWPLNSTLFENQRRFRDGFILPHLMSGEGVFQAAVRRLVDDLTGKAG